MRLVKYCGTTAVSLAVLFLASSSAMGQDAPCSQCGPGPHWTDTCAAGSDRITTQSGTVGISLDLDCDPELSLVMRSCGTFEVSRSAPAGHDIATEIVSLCLESGTVRMVAGVGSGVGGVLAASVGTIVEDVTTPDPTMAKSSFGVFFEVDLGDGTLLYNQTALNIVSDITCVPPLAEYIHIGGCTPLFDAPVGGTQIGNLVSAKHYVGIPAVSEWGLAALMLLVLSAGTVIMMRRRSVQEMA